MPADCWRGIQTSENRKRNERDSPCCARPPTERPCLRNSEPAPGRCMGAKCARAEEHRRKQAIQCEAVPEPLGDIRPAVEPVDEWADTPVSMDPRPIGEDGRRTRDPQPTPMSEPSEPDEEEANGDRVVVHRPRLAVAWLAAIVAGLLVLATPWNNSEEPQVSRGERAPMVPSIDGAEEPIVELVEPGPPRPTAPAPGPSVPGPQDIHGIAHLRVPEPSPERTEKPKQADNGENQVEHRSTPKPAPASSLAPTPPEPTPSNPAPAIIESLYREASTALVRGTRCELYTVAGARFA